MAINVESAKELDARRHTERVLGKEPPRVGDVITALVDLPQVANWHGETVHRAGVVEYVSRHGWMTIKTAQGVRFTALWR
jgi:hypothetical protein